MKKILKNIVIGILSLWSVLAMDLVVNNELSINRLFSRENYSKVILYNNSTDLLGNFTGSTILWLILLVFIFKLIKKTLEKSNKRLKICSIILAVMFALIEVIANCINMTLTIRMFSVILGIYLFKLIGLVIVYYSVLYNLFVKLDEIKFEDKNKEYKFFTRNLRSVLVCILVCLICWLPYFLREFPGILNFDNIYQMQVLQQKNSFVHSILMLFFVNLGKNLFNSATIGIAMLTGFQMFFMASVFSYVIYYMAKQNIRFEVRVITLLYFAFSPAIALMSINLTRDTLFSGLITLLLIMFIEIITNTEAFFKKKVAILFFLIVAFLACEYRGNELYALIVAIPFIVAYKKGYRLKICGLLCSSVLVVIIFNSYITNVLKIEKSPVVEMYSVPLQQIARAYVDNEKDLTEEEIEDFFSVFVKSKIPDLYKPYIADPAKWMASEKKSLEFNKNGVFQVWFKYLVKYPVSYVDAYLGLISGYINPQESRVSIWRGVYPNDLGIENNVIWNSEFVNFVEDTIKTQNIPIYSLFFNAGFEFWMFLTLLMYNIYRKQRAEIFVFLPILLYFLTVCLGPLNNEFRYICFFFTCMPLLWTTTLSRVLANKKNEE